MDKLVRFLYKIKDKPQIFVGSPPSYKVLLEIFPGYTLCLYEELQDSSTFINEFSKYICDYYQIKQHVYRNELTIINLFTESDTAAFYKFYELLDEFLKTRGDNKK